MTTRIGFIGLGQMGKGMAKNLLKKGFDLTVYDIRKEPVDELKLLGAQQSASPEELATASEVIFSMVRDDSQTQEVMWGRNGVLAGIRQGSTIIVTSTVSPTLCQRLAQDASKKGVGVLDSPVSGALPGASAGTLTLMVGGDKNLFENMEPILQAISAKRFHVGGVGLGQVAKLANNVINEINVASCTEGLAFAVKAGIPLKTILEVVRVSSGNCWPIEHWDLYTLLKKNYDGARTLDMAYKVLRVAIEYAKEIGAELPLASQTLEVDLYKLPE